MRERTIEQYLVDECQRFGLVCLKVKTIGRRGFPDRTIIAPGGLVYFVETKTPVGYLSKQQIETIKLLRRVGSKVWIPATYEMIDKLLDEIVFVSDDIQKKIKAGII